ncbi:pilus assembly protein PilM [bacterium]|nr:pilus assembly protein PilM [bacterium]
MPQTIIGIDIGSYSVKIAELERSFKSFELVNFYEKPIQYNEVLTPEESITIALSNVIEEHGIHWDTAICAIQGQDVSCRSINLPFGNTKKIDQTIEFEIENYIPLDLEDVIADYHITRASKDSSSVLVAYCKKEDYIKRITAINNAGVDPRYVSVEGVELISLMNLGMVPPDGPYAIIDIGHKKTTITLCEGKKMSFTRCISIAGEHVTKAIANDLDVPEDEAEQMKIEMGRVALEDTGVVDEMSQKVADSIRRTMEELLLHIRQTLFAFHGEMGVGIQGIFLSGGTSRLPGVDRYFSVKLRQNVTHIDCSQFHFSRLRTSDIHPQILPQALALALRGVAAAGMPDMNFRRGEFAYKGDVQQLGGGVRHVALIVAFLFVISIVHFSIKYYSLKQKVGKVQSDVAALVSQALPDTPKNLISDPSRALATLSGKKQEMEGKIDRLSSDLGASILDIIKNVSNAFPPRDEVNVDIENINIVKGSLKMSGRTDSFEAVDKIRGALEKEKLFSEVSTGNVRKGVRGEVKFDISISLASEEKKER